MGNQIIPFENKEFGTVRTLVIDNEPWFVGKDVAVILGYAKPENAISVHVDDEDKTTTLIQGTGSNYKSKTTIINESGLYSLVISSKLPTAKQFKRWVTSEVLPTIRKTGGYVNDDDKFVDTYFGALSEEYKTVIGTMLKELRKNKEIIAEQGTLIAKQGAAIEEMTPKATYYDTILNCKDLVPTTLIAKDFGMSARAMNALLHDYHVQFKQGNTWVLYSKYHNEGYAQIVTVPYETKEGTKLNYLLKWTQKGRTMIYNLLKKNGFLPVMERV